MNCPVCQSVRLNASALEEDLSSFTCSNCGGSWIRGTEYWRWLQDRGPNLPERLEPPDDQVPPGDKDLRPCPECKIMMVKYKVGRGLAFSLDQCVGCKGVWFDKREWEALRQRNLHDDIHAIFTAPWQSEATREERRRRLEQIYVRKYGKEDYEEIKRVRAWLDGHSRRHELLAYLTDPDPLSV